MEQIEIVEKARELGYNFVINDALEAIKEALSEDLSPRADLSRRLVECLDRLPPGYSEEAAGIRERLRASRS